MSVSLTLLEHNPQDASAPDANNFWIESIRRVSGENEEVEKSSEGKEKGHQEERQEKEKVIPPKKIDGIGQEAYWSGSRFGGALYVLAKDAILRISAGGPDNEEAKIEKSKKLAEKALARLP